MIDIMSHRIRIGLYNLRTNQYRCTLTNTRNHGNSNTNIHFVLYTACLLLLICSDIELNPGPVPPTRSTSTISSENCSSTSTIFRTSKKKLSILHINAQSIRHKMDAFRAESAGYDIICVTETWLNPNIDNDTISMDGFHNPFRKDRNDSHGGVAIYINESLHVTGKPEYDVDGLETVWVEVKTTHFKCLINATYRPPNSAAEYWRKLEESIEKAKND